MFTRKQYKRRKRQVKITSQELFKKKFKKKKKKKRTMSGPVEMALDGQFPWGAYRGKTLREVIDKHYFYFNMACDKGWITITPEAEAYAKESDGYQTALAKSQKWTKMIDRMK